MAKFICFLEWRFRVDFYIKLQLIDFTVDREEGKRNFINALDDAFDLIDWG